MLRNHSFGSGSLPDVRPETIARRLGAMAALSADEADFLHRAGAGAASLWAPRSLLEHTPGEFASPRYIISGWAARVRELRDGRRQLVQLLLPGETLTPHLNVRQDGSTVQAITLVRTVDGTAIRVAAGEPSKYPGIAEAVALAAAHDRALLMEQVVRLGRQTAHERMVNLMLELHYRCSAVGLVHDESFEFPLTQEALGDLLGLSVVHVNRTLQLLRQQELIQLKHGRLTLLNMAGLAEVAEFKPPRLTYAN